MPSGDVDRLEKSDPGFLEATLHTQSERVNAHLRKRYAVPFANPVPEMVLDWVVRLATAIAYAKRGINPSSGDTYVALIAERATTAEEEIAEAANAQFGLFDLPLRQDTTKTGIVKGAPISYSEASPYVGHDIQRRRGRMEDMRQ